MFSTLEAHKRWQKMWHQGKLVWFYGSLIAAPIFIFLGFVSMFGAIEYAVRCFIGAAIFIIIAYKLKDEKNKNI